MSLIFFNPLISLNISFSAFSFGESSHIFLSVPPPAPAVRAFMSVYVAILIQWNIRREMLCFLSTTCCFLNIILWRSFPQFLKTSQEHLKDFKLLLVMRLPLVIKTHDQVFRFIKTLSSGVVQRFCHFTSSDLITTCPFPPPHSFSPIPFHPNVPPCSVAFFPHHY